MCARLVVAWCALHGEATRSEGDLDHQRHHHFRFAPLPSRGRLLPPTPFLLAFLLHLLCLPLHPPRATAVETGPPPTDPSSPTLDDVAWLKSQLSLNSTQEPPTSTAAWHSLRKGINPRTSAQQLEDLRRFKGISRYESDDAVNHTALPCPGEFLVEEHFSNYGEPWAGGRDVFEFLAAAAGLAPADYCSRSGAARSGLVSTSSDILTRPDSTVSSPTSSPLWPPSAMSSLLTASAPLSCLYRAASSTSGFSFSAGGRRRTWNSATLEAKFSTISSTPARCSFTCPTRWSGLEWRGCQGSNQRKVGSVSHNIEFCSRLGGKECTKRLTKMGLEYVGKRTHDSFFQAL